MRAGVYALLAANLAAAALLLAGGGFSIDRNVALALASPAPAIAGGLLLQRRGYLRLGGFLEAFGAFACLSITTMLVLIPLAASGAPYVDAPLARADAALGFNYRRAVDWMLPAADWLRLIYATFQVQACLVPAILFARGDTERGWRFLLVVGVTLAATDLFFPLFPAQGAAVHFGLPLSYRAAVGDLSWHFPAVLDAVRNGARHIDKPMLTGLVSFPSFHAAAALIYAWALWPIRWARWPAVALNIGVCVSAVFVGAHYLIDVLAGVALALVVIRLIDAVAYWHSRQNQFSSSVPSVQVVAQLKNTSK